MTCDNPDGATIGSVRDAIFRQLSIVFSARRSDSPERFNSTRVSSRGDTQQYPVGWCDRNILRQFPRGPSAKKWGALYNTTGFSLREVMSSCLCDGALF